MNSLQSKKQKQELKALQEVAENLQIQTDTVNKATNQVDRANFHVSEMHKNIDSRIEKKRALLESLKKRKGNPALGNEAVLEKIKSLKSENILDLPTISMIDTPQVFEQWSEVVNENRRFAEENDIDLSNPYLEMFSNVEQIQIRRDLIEKYDLLQLEKEDYLFASAAGIIAGFIDIAFVGTIRTGSDATGIQKGVDAGVEKIVQWYGKQERLGELEARLKEANTREGKERIGKLIDLTKGNKVMDKSGNMRTRTVKDSIKFLEKAHRVSFDAAIHSSIDGMTPNNHHLFSIAHEPSLLGLIVGIIDQMTGKGTFIDANGKLLRVVTQNKNKELSGNLLQSIGQAVQNWFGHIMSDISGSSTSKGRGSGLPVPGFSALQKLKMGNITLNERSKNMDVAQVSEWMFKNGYDVRAFTAELIPVVIYETLLRCYWFWKQHFYFGKSLKESIPIANNRELARLLLCSAASFSTIDVTHATIKSKPGNPVFLATFIMTVNKPGLIDFGIRSYQVFRYEMEHNQKLQKELVKTSEELMQEVNRNSF